MGPVHTQHKVLTVITPLQIGQSGLESKFGPQSTKWSPREWFGENISKLLIRIDELGDKLSKGHLLANKVIINLNVLGSCMKDMIDCHVESTHIVIK